LPSYYLHDLRGRRLSAALPAVIALVLASISVVRFFARTAKNEPQKEEVDSSRYIARIAAPIRD
jgi:hypothetical protein